MPTKSKSRHKLKMEIEKALNKLNFNGKIIRWKNKK